MWPNPQFSADLVRFIGEILNRKLHFLYSVCKLSMTPNHLKLLCTLEWWTRILLLQVNCIANMSEFKQGFKETPISLLLTSGNYNRGQNIFDRPSISFKITQTGKFQYLIFSILLVLKKFSSAFFVKDPFCTLHSICPNIGFWQVNFEWKFCAFISSTFNKKTVLHSFRNGFRFSENVQNLQWLSRNMYRSCKWRPILKIRRTVFYRYPRSFCWL